MLYLQNTFHLDHQAVVKLRGEHDFAKNLVDIGFDWHGQWADAAIFTDFAKYPNLRILRVKFWMSTLNWVNYRRRVRNFSFQHDEDLSWFSKVRGYDQVFRLRGLEKVTFELMGTIDNDKKAKAPVARKAMEDLLNRELTQPKYIPPAVSSLLFCGTFPLIRNADFLQKATKRRGRQIEDNGEETDEDDEDSEQEYVPRPTKSRHAKTMIESYNEAAE